MFQTKDAEKSKRTFHIQQLVFENCAVYEVKWKNIEPGRPQMKIWRVRFACWYPRLQTRTQDM